MKKNGFTLVEIVIVVSILGILAAMGTLAVSKSINNSRRKTAESELQILSSAVLELAWDTGKWPNGAWRTDPGSDQVSDISSPRAGLMYAANNIYPDWKGPYYEGSVKDSWNTPYFFDPAYRGPATSNEARVVVGSCGPDRASQSDDIIILLDD
ncbi:MAG: prepilin-type N-terminal cleavage/methylation domain-containing protein [Verrucomicrobiota bacterium]